MADTGEGSAKAVLERTLGDYGLASLASWAWERYLDGYPMDQILLDLRARPEYQARFPAMRRLAERGRAISEAEYIAYETQATQMMRAAGLPEGFYDSTEDFATLLEAEVSVAELGERIDIARGAVYQAPVEVRAELERVYGLGPGELTAYWLDPDRALPVIERQYGAAQIAGAARRSGYGLLTRDEAERLSDLGIDAAGASSGFETLVSAHEVFEVLPGEERSEASIGRDVQLAAAFEDDAAAAGQVERRVAKRLAAFADSGRYAAGETGVRGLRA